MKDPIHIRKRWNAPASEPAYCGAVGCTITDAWGFWGPGGDGYQDVCKECVRLKKEDRR